MKQKIVDGHIHISQWYIDDSEITFDVLRKYQEKNGISAVDNMCTSNDSKIWEGTEADQTILGAIAKLENPSVFAHGCLYIPENSAELTKFDFKNQFEELMELGLDGIKICDFKPDVYKLFDVENRLDKYDEYIGLCEKYGVHMCWHVGDPKTCWDPDKVSEDAKKNGWFYGDGTYPTYQRLTKLANNFIENHQNLNLTLAHIFFKENSPDEVINLFESYPNVTFDLAPHWGMFAGFREHYEKWYNIFRKYSDRFIYGTDVVSPFLPQQMDKTAQLVLRFLQTDDEFELINGKTAIGIKLEQEHLDNILYKNHERCVGEKPKEINRVALKKYIARYLPLLPNTLNTRKTEEYYRKNLL